MHGFNNNTETFTFMTEGMREMMKDIAEFYFVEGSYTLDEKMVPPEPALAERGFKGPFKSWFEPIIAPGSEEKKLIAEYQKRFPLAKEDGGGVYRISKNSKRSVDEIVKASMIHGPFDGVLSFSQGSAMYRVLYLHTQVLHKSEYEDFVFPRFILSFSGAVFNEYLLLIDG